MEEKEKKKEERTAYLLGAWPRLTETQMDAFTMAIRGQEAFNAIEKAFGQGKCLHKGMSV